MPSTVRSAALTNFADVARQLGYNPDEALRQAGLHPLTLTQPDTRIPGELAVSLLEDAAQATACESFGLRMAHSRQLADLGVVSLLLANQPTLRDVLGTTVEYVHFLNESLALLVEDAGNLVVVREELMSAVPNRQAIELAIGSLYRLCAAVMGDNWHPRSVNFSHAAPANTAMHRQTFQCKVVFNSEFNGMVFQASDLDVATPHADPAIARYARQIVEARPRPGESSQQLEVRKAIYLMLPGGRASCEAVAHGLGRSLRTLQRQLEQEHITFSQLLDDVRRDMALRYMKIPRYTTGHIAELLGYGTHSAFTRWFKAQFGCTPSQWRNR